MQITITGRHVQVTSALKSFINEKLGKLEAMFPRVKKAQVVLTVEKYRHTVELHFHADHAEFSARKTTKDMYASMEACVDAIARQAGKRKDKLRSQKSRRHLLSRVRRSVESSRKEEDSSFDVEVEALPVAAAPRRRVLGRLPRIVRLKNAGEGPFKEEEAAEALSESGQGFLVYEDSRTGRAHVMFKREDGTFGLIEA